jgi:hypothetical protein
MFYDLGFASAVDPLNSIPFNSLRTVDATGVPFGDNGPVYGFARDLRIPYSWQWNVTVEGRVPGGGIASAAWVGSTGRNLLRREGYLSAGTQIPDLVLATSHGNSNYEAFQANFRGRIRSGLDGIASYTWSHSIDNGSWDSGTYVVRDGFNAPQDRGPSNFDVRHSLSAGFNYDLPARVARGWSLHGIIHMRTGFPIDVVARENAFGLGFDNVARPDLVPGVPIWIHEDGLPGGRRLNPAAFSVPEAGRQGTLGRNALRGFGMTQLDASLERRWSLPRSSLHLRVQAYNVTNNHSFADPVRALSSPLFGQPASLMSLMFGTGRPMSGLTPAFQSGGPRTLEIAVRWSF